MNTPRTRRFKQKARKKERKRHLISVSPSVRQMLDELVLIHDVSSAPDIVRKLVEAELVREQELARRKEAASGGRLDQDQG